MISSDSYGLKRGRVIRYTQIISSQLLKITTKIESDLIAILIVKMKFLQSVQKHFATLGISSSQSNHKYPFINGKILMVYLGFLLGIISFCVFLILEVNNFQEYTETIFRITLLICMFITFMIVILKMGQLFRLIDDCEKLVDKSKLIHTIFTESTSSFFVI